MTGIWCRPKLILAKENKQIIVPCCLSFGAQIEKHLLLRVCTIMWLVSFVYGGVLLCLIYTHVLIPTRTCLPFYLKDEQEFNPFVLTHQVFFSLLQIIQCIVPTCAYYFILHTVRKSASKIKIHASKVRTVSLTTVKIMLHIIANISGNLPIAFVLVLALTDVSIIESLSLWTSMVILPLSPILHTVFYQLL